MDFLPTVHLVSYFKSKLPKKWENHFPDRNFTVLTEIILFIINKHKLIDLDLSDPSKQLNIKGQ